MKMKLYYLSANHCNTGINNTMNKHGFSLLEVGVALLILSLSVTAVFQFISSTTISLYSIEDKAYAREIANNRLALINTHEPFIGQSKRLGEHNFGGKKFYWSEEIVDTSPEFFELTIYVGLSIDQPIHQFKTFIERK